MTDIVEKLRQWAVFGYGVEASADMKKAADEIERLRAENAKLDDENFALSTWQCEFTDGKTGLVASEGGSTYCAMAREVERLRRTLMRFDAGYDVYAEAREEYRKKIAEQAEEIERLRNDLRLAVMSDSEECKVLSQEVERLVKSRNRWGQKYNALLEKHKRLRAALEEIISVTEGEWGPAALAGEVARAALTGKPEGLDREAMPAPKKENE